MNTYNYCWFFLYCDYYYSHVWQCSKLFQVTSYFFVCYVTFLRSALMLRMFGLFLFLHLIQYISMYCTKQIMWCKNKRSKFQPKPRTKPQQYRFPIDFSLYFLYARMQKHSHYFIWYNVDVKMDTINHVQ